jgi:hypothetical protein
MQYNLPSKYGVPLYNEALPPGALAIPSDDDFFNGRPKNPD